MYKVCGAREMAQQVKRLPHKCEDRSLIPGVHVKTEQAQHPTYKHGAWGAETGDTGKSNGKQPRKTSDIKLWLPRTCIRNCKYTHTHVCTLYTGPWKGKDVDSINLKTRFKTKKNRWFHR